MSGQQKGAEQVSSPEHAADRASLLAEASGELVPMSFPGARRVAGWLFWVVFPLLSVAALAFAIMAIISHVGRTPPGLHGNFVGGRHCSHGVCLVSGTFTSDDGKVVVRSLIGDPRWKVGEQHAVIYDGKSAEVAGISHWDATTSVLAGVGSTTYLAVVGYLWWTARTPRTSGAKRSISLTA
ncbi:MAG TPA: hypothetical protein VGH11_00840 [Jatrophihabitans sp.]|jgi:hypothetical protein